MSLIQGVVTAVVTKIDEEIPGRIKVRFNAHEQSHETDWIRIATTMGGKNRGTFFMPEKDDEVLGFLWNGPDTPPADHVRLRRIQSVNGHNITFVDASENNGSKGALYIEDAHGNIISMSNGKIVIKSVGVLEIQAPNVTINGRIVSPNANPI
jgi:phage baseplate assembly protein gpV